MASTECEFLQLFMVIVLSQHLFVWVQWHHNLLWLLGWFLVIARAIFWLEVTELVDKLVLLVLANNQGDASSADNVCHFVDAHVAPGLIGVLRITRRVSPLFLVFTEVLEISPNVNLAFLVKSYCEVLAALYLDKDVP